MAVVFSAHCGMGWGGDGNELFRSMLPRSQQSVSIHLRRVEGAFVGLDYVCHSMLEVIDTVDGRNPAPPGMYITL